MCFHDNLLQRVIFVFMIFLRYNQCMVQRLLCACAKSCLHLNGVLDMCLLKIYVGGVKKRNS